MSRMIILLNLLTSMMVAMLSVGFISCGGDDDEDNGSIGDELVTKLQGKWEFYGGKETVMGTTITMDKSTLNEIKSMMSSATGQRVYFWDETLNFNGYQVNGIKYSLKGSQLIMDGMELFEGFTINVKSINSTTLVLHEVISMEGIDIVADIEYHKESTNNTENNNSNENSGNGNTNESTEYIATEQVKTITLKPATNQEYLIYKDFYWKHKLYLDGTTICFNSYYGGGNGWTLNNGGYSRSGENHVGIRDRGEMNGISDITDTTIKYSSWVTSTKCFNIYGGSSYVQYLVEVLPLSPSMVMKSHL